MAIRDRRQDSAHNKHHPIKENFDGDAGHFGDVEFFYNPDKEFDMLISGFWWHTRSGSLNVPYTASATYWTNRHFGATRIAHSPVGNGSSTTNLVNWRVARAGDPGSRTAVANEQINRNLILSLDNTEINFGYKHELTEAIDDVIKKGSGGVLEKAQQLLEGIRAAAAVTAGAGGAGTGGDPGRFLPVYKKVKAWTGTSPLQINSIKLNFYFGQAGLFDAFEEVVKPITRLVEINMPTGAGPNIFKGPVPTVAFLVQEFVANFALGVLSNDDNKGFLDLGSGISSETDDKLRNASNLATGILNRVYQTYNTAVEKAMSGNSKLFTFRMGRMVWGPCLVSEVKWAFDFSEVDSNGMPTRGWIELGGIEKMTMALPHDIHILPKSGNEIVPVNDPHITVS